MKSSKLVWFPDATRGYSIGQIVDLNQSSVSIQPVAFAPNNSITFELIEEQQVQASSQQELQVQSFAYEQVFSCDQLDLDWLRRHSNRAISNSSSKSSKAQIDGSDWPDVDDNCALVQLNEAALLENVRVRFHRNKIYTYVANILIAVNPYFEIHNLHSIETIRSYQGKSLGTMPPHVFAIADKAYRDMKAFKQSQSIIINGESGAGKTESQKYVLRFLCLSGNQSGRLEKLILDANPILEAFGNAKTIRNNNSSRFGKFIEIHYTSKFTVSGGLFLHYLLEKSRICTQSKGERNYHIFYQLCACLPEAQWQELQLGPPDRFRYLNGGCTQYFCSKEDDSKLSSSRKSQFHEQNGSIQDQLIDDLKCYEQTDRALSNFGIDSQEKLAIYSIVAAVLHLGNIRFCDDPEDKQAGCLVEAGQAEEALATTAKLVKLDKELLRQSLVTRVMSTGRAGHKGTVYMVNLSVQQAQAARDALAKSIYSKLFDHIVTRIVNKQIPYESTNAPTNYIGVLDVAGFEYFQHNSFEQFLINFCNEKLQQFFNERLLKEEQTIYEKEGLRVSKVQFVDNYDCIQLYEAKSTGMFDLLDEESRLPKPNASHFTQSVHAANKGHFRLALPRTSKLKCHREIRDDEGFLIRHFAGAVCYETGAFIDKNNDALHASLKNLMLEAEHKLLCQLFSDSSATSPAELPVASKHANINLPSTGGHSHNKLNYVSVATTFRSQLGNLMQKLQCTGSHFIRCIKPNSEMVAHKFEGAQILSQMHCSGMNSVLKLMQQGYPSRSHFNDIYSAYKRYLPPKLARLDPHLFCRALFKAIGLNDNDFRFGSSKVFFKPGKFAEFDEIIRGSNEEHVAELVDRVSRWLLRSRWRKVLYCCLSAIKLKNKILFRRQIIINVQKNWRMTIAMLTFKFRLNAIRCGKQILSSLLEFESIGNQLEPKQAEVISQETMALRQEVESFIERYRVEVQQLANNNNHKLLSSDTNELASDRKEANRSCQAQLDKLLTKRDLLVRSIKDKQAKQKELAELEAKMKAENKRREQEEVARRNELALKQQRKELELRRQTEMLMSSNEAQGGQGHKSQKNLVDTGTDPMESHGSDEFEAMISCNEFAEQEQRDYELAMRLAQDGSDSSPGSSVVSTSTVRNKVIAPVAPSEAFSAPSATTGEVSTDCGANYDLSKWKYSDLRDTINTSCDLELLEACKREFHRRLKVYHAWRASNSRQKQGAEAAIDQSRAPISVMQQSRLSASSPSSCSQSMARTGSGSATSIGEQRYFRIPFIKSKQRSASSASNQRGWWFAHFDGQWIARQLEIHPDKEPILLVAGQDDIEMCELSLDETRLTSKRGAEILPREFEDEWLKYGGSAYRGRAQQNNGQQHLSEPKGLASQPYQANRIK